MAEGSERLLEEFREAVIGPACVDFAARVGAEEPSPLVSGGRVGYEVRLPASFLGPEAESVVVCAEPFDDEAFTVKASRPDAPNQLRQIAIVRYAALRDDETRDDEATRVRADVGGALEQLHQGLTNR